MTDQLESHRQAIESAKRHVTYVRAAADRALADTTFSMDVRLLAHLAEHHAQSKLDDLRQQGEEAVVALYQEEHE